MSILLDGGSSQSVISSSTPVTSRPCTMMVRFRASTTSQDACLLQITDSGGGSDWFWIYWGGSAYSGAIEAGVRDSGFQQAQSSNTVTDTTTWHTALVHIGASQVRTVLDGDYANAGTVSVSLNPQGLDRIAIGAARDSSPSAYYSGYLADVAIWSVDLYQAEGEALAAGVSPANIRPGALEVYAPLLDDIADDQSAVTFSGTYTQASSEHPASGTPDNALATTEPTQPSSRVQVATDSSTDGTLGIPRWKIHQDQTYPWNIWLTIYATGTDCYHSNDWGATWTAVEDVDWSDHVASWLDADGRLHTIDRGTSGNPTYRQFYASQYVAPFHRTDDDDGSFNDFSGASTSQAGILSDGDDVWFANRIRTGTGSDAIYVHYSADGGATWTGTYQLGSTDTFLDMHRAGMLSISGRPAVAVWEEQASGGPRITLYRWDGTDSFDEDADYIQISADDALTRQFAMIEDSGGTVHCVWYDYTDATHRLYHAYKTWGNSWSTPALIGAVGHDDPLPSLGRQGTTVYLVYQDSSGNIQMRTWRGSSWSSETTVDDAATDKRHPQVPPIIPANADYVPVVYVEGTTVYCDFVGAITGTTYNVSASDGVSMSDSPSGTLSIAASASDGVSTSDAPSGVLLMQVSAADGLAMADAPTGPLTIAQTIADGISLSDAASGAFTFSVATADGVTFADSASDSGGTLFAVTVADGISLSDSSNAVLQLVASVADGIQVGDSTSSTATINAVVNDGVSFSDVVSTALAIVASVSDGIKLSDVAIDTTFLPVGRVQVTVTSARASVSITYKQAGVTVAAKQAVVTVTN